MKVKSNTTLALTCLAAVTVMLSSASVASAQDQDQMRYHRDSEIDKNAHPAERPYSPWVDQNFPQRPLFGDTHLHTSVSFDAVAFGTTLTPEDAYRFALGEEITSSTGVRGKLSRPLDFLVVADHAENMGTMGAMKEGLPELMTDPTVRKWHKQLQAGGEEAMKPYYDIVNSLGKTPLPAVLTNERLTRSIWEQQIDAAEKYNEPGSFTALIGYEWSSNSGGNNLHRVVVYRDGANRAEQMLPFSSFISENPEDLWKWMAQYEKETNGQLLAIPHNGNLSNGRMFQDTQFDGSPITPEWAQTRSNYEPIYEATQMKGDGEAHPFLSPNDEFADYETWDKGNLNLSVPKEDNMLQYEYARAGLKLGLKIEQQTGTNPYQFGMIGSTDAHTSLAAVAEDNFFGKLPHVEPSDHRMSATMLKFNETAIMASDMAASGYAAVWAYENTREAIFDAMQRRETYATTGPRMVVRLFGGWDFEAKDAHTRRPAIEGYKRGVPMGGELSQAPRGKAPTFLVAALKDPIGANLDRYQIVKGWLDSDGKMHEKVYDVIWSGDRKPASNGKLSPVGNTVDVANATYSNTIGATELIAVWEDPDFDPRQRAFYYGRVIEIPTPRWTAYDAKHYKLELSNDIQMVTQERAYTSPIWYTPGS